MWTGIYVYKKVRRNKVHFKLDIIVIVIIPNTLYRDTNLSKSKFKKKNARSKSNYTGHNVSFT